MELEYAQFLHFMNCVEKYNKKFPELCKVIINSVDYNANNVFIRKYVLFDMKIDYSMCDGYELIEVKNNNLCHKCRKDKEVFVIENEKGKAQYCKRCLKDILDIKLFDKKKKVIDMLLKESKGRNIKPMVFVDVRKYLNTAYTFAKAGVRYKNRTKSINDKTYISTHDIVMEYYNNENQFLMDWNLLLEYARQISYMNVVDILCNKYIEVDQAKYITFLAFIYYDNEKEAKQLEKENLLSIKLNPVKSYQINDKINTEAKLMYYTCELKSYFNEIDEIYTYVFFDDEYCYKWETGVSKIARESNIGKKFLITGSVTDIFDYGQKKGVRIKNGVRKRID